MPERRVREPTKTQQKIDEAVAKIPEIREQEGYVSPTRETYAPVGDPGLLSDEDLVVIDEEMDKALGTTTIAARVADVTQEEFDRMKEVFKDMSAEPEPVPEGRDMRPGKDKMMPLSGGLYLPVRRRVAWMRGEPIARPTWSIVNTLLKYEMGTLESPKGGGPGGKMPKIAGGFAVVKSEVLTEMGQIIATGYAQERSEVFPDFIEKAETAAVGRAMALAGFGTEAAIDLDEGLDQENVVDAPVKDRPIMITGSDIAGVKVGGRTPNITNAQLKEIGRLVRAVELSPQGLASLIEKTNSITIPASAIEDEVSANTFIGSLIKDFTNEQAAALIGELMKLEAMVTA